LQDVQEMMPLNLRRIEVECLRILLLGFPQHSECMLRVSRYPQS
jgi:hypothetical protein